MRSSTTELRAFFLTATDATVVDLVTMTLIDASVYRWTSHTDDIVYGGNTYTAGGTGTAPLLGRGRIRDTVGLDPAELTMTFTCGSSAMLGSSTFQAAAMNGLLDGAGIQVRRCYLGSGDAVIGTLLRFQGQASATRCGTNSVEVQVRSQLEALNEELPRHLYQPLCGYVLFDAACGVSRAAYTATSTTSAGSTTTVVNHSLGTAVSYYVGGAITFTSGALNGLSRTITASTGTTITVSIPLPSAPGTGDGFSVYPGCDKTIATCRTKFLNLPRRRGADFVPTPELVS